MPSLSTDLSPALRSRLPAVGTTIFTVMSALAQEHGALNLSQGFPDFEPPAELLSLLDQAARGGHHQDAPMAGLPGPPQLVVLNQFDPVPERPAFSIGDPRILGVVPTSTVTGEGIEELRRLLFQTISEAPAPSRFATPSARYRICASFTLFPEPGVVSVIHCWLHSVWGVSVQLPLQGTTNTPPTSP